MPRKSSKPASGVTLRLKQNAFVNGKVELKGFTLSFTPEEAKRRLSRTRLWEMA